MGRGTPCVPVAGCCKAARQPSSPQLMYQLTSLPLSPAPHPWSGGHSSSSLPCPLTSSPPHFHSYLHLPLSPVRPNFRSAPPPRSSSSGRVSLPPPSQCIPSLLPPPLTSHLYLPLFGRPLLPAVPAQVVCLPVSVALSIRFIVLCCGVKQYDCGVKQQHCGVKQQHLLSVSQGQGAGL